jgi:membrane protein YdbS with pleckstrin-like domain
VEVYYRLPLPTKTGSALLSGLKSLLQLVCAYCTDSSATQEAPVLTHIGIAALALFLLLLLLVLLPLLRLRRRWSWRRRWGTGLESTILEFDVLQGK